MTLVSFELTTSRFSVWCSTSELQGLNKIDYKVAKVTFHNLYFLSSILIFYIYIAVNLQIPDLRIELSWPEGDGVTARPLSINV